MERTQDNPDRRKSSPRWLWWIGGLVVLLLLIFLSAPLLLEERVRSTIETQMNERLEGYSVSLSAVDLHLLGLAVSLKNLTITQDAHPDPPVAHIPVLNAAVQWSQILRGRLVADFLFERPVVHINLQQLRQEVEDEIPVEERGWQEALEAAYFLDFNLIRVIDGELTYIDDDPDRPLHAAGIRFRAENIRGSPGPEERYPSPFRFEAVIFSAGHGTLEGYADFLAKPVPGFRGRVELREVPLDHFRPVLARAGAIVTQGVMDASGEMEFASDVNRLDIEELTVRDVLLDYIRTTTAGQEEENGGSGAEAVETVVEGPDPAALQLRIGRLNLRGDFGLVNKEEDPSYRVFLSETDLRLTGYSNHFREGEAEATLSGLFMGSGRTFAAATFRPEQAGPDFDIKIEVNETHLPAMNDLLRAYGNFDVVEGHFSFFAEFTIHEGHIEGYMRPLFGDMEVYDRRQDEDKGLLQQLYERAVGVISGILENVPRDEVATQVEISGPLDDPEASTWQIIVGLLRNAFFRAILPGFEDELSD